MKKLLMILVLGSFVACNDSAGTAEGTKDSLENKMDSTTEAKTDSIDDQKDSLINKLDSTNDAKVDSMK